VSSFLTAHQHIIGHSVKPKPPLPHACIYTVPW